LFAVKTQVLRELFADAEWKGRIDEAKTGEDVYLVIEAFVEARGWKVEEIPSELLLSVQTVKT